MKFSRIEGSNFRTSDLSAYPCSFAGDSKTFSLAGNTGSISTYSPDYGFSTSPSGIREAASSLVTALQGCSAPPSPDAHIAKALQAWIQVSEQFLPVFQPKRPVTTLIINHATFIRRAV